MVEGQNKGLEEMRMDIAESSETIEQATELSQECLTKIAD